MHAQVPFVARTKPETVMEVDSRGLGGKNSNRNLVTSAGSKTVVFIKTVPLIPTSCNEAIHMESTNSTRNFTVTKSCIY